MDDIKTQVYAQLDSNQTQVGYDEGSGHEFTASQHERILEDSGIETGDAFSDATASLERNTLKLQLAMDASNVIKKRRDEAAKLVTQLATETELPPLRDMTMRSMFERPEAAQADPEKAAAAAVVEANAPLGTPTKQLTALGMQEWQLGTLAKLVEGKKWIFSKDSYAADFLAMAVNPVRTIFGQSRAGSELQSKESYYAFVEQWHKLPQAEQEIVWEGVLQKMKEASGGNDLVLFGLVTPLIYPTEKNMPYVDAAFDIIDTGGSAWAALTLSKGLRAKFAYRNRVISTGNDSEAGKATVKAIKKGDPDAVSDGHPIPDPIVPSRVAGPTELAIEAELRGQGKLADGERLIEHANPLRPEDVTRAVADRQAVVEKAGGKIVSTDVGPTGVEFTYSMKVAGTKIRVKDIAGTLAQLDKMATETANEIKLLVTGSDPGQNADKVSELTERLNVIKDRTQTIKDHVAKGVVGQPQIEGFPTTVIGKKFFQFTVDDVGQWNFRDRVIGPIVHMIGTPETRIGAIVDGLVSKGTNLRQQQRRVFGYFDKEVTKIRRNLSGLEQEDLHKLLLTGDRKQVIFTEEELRAGVQVDGIGLISYGEESIKSYKRLRQAFDDLYVLVNKMQVDELKFGGYEMFFGKLTDSKGVTTPVRVFGKTNKIAFTPPKNGYEKNISAALDFRVGSATKGEPVALNSIGDLKARLDSRQSGFIELRHPFRTSDGKQYSYAIVDVDQLGTARGANQIDTVLDYRRGYVPKLAQENVKWIVERPMNRFVDGHKVADSKIVRGFETESEADIFLAQLKASGKKGTYRKQELTKDWRNDVRNREKSEFIDNSMFRGAFVGHREENGKFRVGLDGREAARMSSFDSLQRYADYVAAYVPMHLWKQAMIKRFLDSTKLDKSLKILGRWDAPLNGTGNDYVNLKAMQDYMKSVFAVPTTEELMFSKLTDGALRMLERAIYNVKKGKQRPFTEPLRALHHKIATSPGSRDPISGLKSISFDLMLGAFNPAQFFVQSAGMAIPMTLDPINAMKAIPEFSFMRGAVHMEDYLEAAKASKKLGMNPTKMKTMLHAWHRSGIMDSILENADFGHYAGTHGAYYSPSMLDSLRQRSRMFYNAGEMNNRLYSFIIAFNKKAKDGAWDLTKPLNSDQLNEVIKEALRINTNMTAANKAKWQDGWLGMPTQFWQQSHKYYENLFYGLARKQGSKENQWTMQESVTALAMNLLLFGAAGYGFDEIFDDLDRSMVAWGLDPERDRSAVAFLRGGLLEMFSLSALGFEVDISDRVGPSGGTTILFDKVLKPAAETAMSGRPSDIAAAAGGVLLGPSLTSLGRILNAGRNFVVQMQADVPDNEWDFNTLVVTAKEMSMVTTSMTNLEKALAWKAANDILNNNNMPLYIVEDGNEIPTSLLLMKAMGFDPLAKEKMEKLLREKKMDDQDLQSLSRNIAADYRKFILAGEGGSLAGKAEVEAAARRLTLRKRQIAETFGKAKAEEVMANVLDILNTEMSQVGQSPYMQTLFEAILAAEPESDREKMIRENYELAKKLRIKGTEEDAE